jgi:hypothetical protein
MRESMTRLGTWAVVVGGLFLASTNAQANPSPTCSWGAPYYANATTGDVVAYPISTVNPMLQSVFSDVGMQFGHVAMVANTSGSMIWEQHASGNLGIQKGGCSLPIDPTSLRNLQPGVAYDPVADNGVTILQRGYGSCSAPASSYKIHSLTTRMTNGNCASYLADSCGVPFVDRSWYAGSSAPDFYKAVHDYVIGQSSWLGGLTISLACGGVSMDQMGDRAAMQVLNEFFFGWGDQNVNYWTGAYYQYPNPANHAPANWPQTADPGPSPDGVYAAHTGTKVTGVYTQQSWQCSCSYGYYYNPATGTCDPMSIAYVRDWLTGAGYTAHVGSYIEIYGSGFSSSNNVVWLGTTNLTVVYNSPNQVNAYVPPGTPVGLQQFEIANPGVGYALANVTAM